MSEAQVTATPATEPAAQKVEEAGFKVFTGNLSYTTNDEGLKTFFSAHASNIISAQVILRGTRSAGYGFVAFKTLGAAEVAVAELNGKELEGRPLIVEIAKPAEKKDQERKEKKASARKPGRRGAKAVPGEVTEQEANGTAPPADAVAGTDEAAKPKKKKKKSAKKSAAATAEGGDAAAAAPGTEGAAPADGAAEKRAPRVKKPRAPRPQREPGVDPVGEHSKSMLFVANLGFNTDDAALHSLFTDAGIKVVSARIVRRRWGQPRKSKGYGFVDVGDEEEQKKAIEKLEGKEVDGRVIAVKVAVNTPKEDDAAEEAGAQPEAVVVAT